MYTIVLAAFLTTGNEIPDFGRRGGGCHGCRGGWGGCYGGCMGMGYGYGGCMGCYGGCGGGCFGYGGGCFGCYGGCFGCGGGCFGCGGGMMAMSAGGCMGAQGGGGAGAQGGRGGPGAQGGGGGSAGGTQTLQELKASVEALKKQQTQIRIDALKLTAEGLKLRETDQKIDELRRDVNEMRRRLPPLPPGGPPKNRRELPPPQSGKVQQEVPADGQWYTTGEAISSPAHITVRLPADARLTVHGVACPLTSDTRTFETPALAPGQTYYYLLKAEVVRDGRSIAQTRRVDFRSGQRVTVSFENFGANLVTAR